MTASQRIAELEEALAAATTPRPKSGPRVWEPLTEAEAAQTARTARPATAPCLCGCGTETKSRFAPGHDATHHQRLRATIAAGGPAAANASLALAAFGWAD